MEATTIQKPPSLTPWKATTFDVLSCDVSLSGQCWSLYHADRAYREGIRYGCGHYVVVREGPKRDCGSKYCIYSGRHMQKCPHCPNCNRYYGPDHEQTVVKDTKAYCNDCEYWYKGPGSIPRR
ncbi:hypothetical protein J132_05673 [Termitomyces sp. J132]|nr:hypothetical protein J132_05673 [Termitomyces sp. J132]